ncbi:uncharacterized protein LOC131664092 [Phymastichus coffea]|uniref:uncharacterized protein LOC131664092 n=1 Tax=Phymastichus coffea TaxID=108790 RepID=UPI00273C96C2|nr:uncharacterized protein LOC131664092 [Phymastichus coffea]
MPQSEERCCVKGCAGASQSGSNDALSFHQIPVANKNQVLRNNLFGKAEKIDIRKQWLKILKIKNPYPRLRVCSHHFKETDYFLPGVETRRKTLLKTAVPSVNLPMSEKEKENAQRNKNEFSKKDQPVTVNQNTEQLVVNNKEFNISDENYCNQELKNDNLDNMNRDLEEDIVLSLINEQNSNEKMSTATGIPTIKSLDTIIALIKEIHKNIYDSPNLTTRDKVILTYMTLKHNMSYRLLALIFNVNAQKFEKIFKLIIKILNNILATAISWPSREEISKNLPMCFEGFENTRVVLDCVSPAGLITFVSPAYGGRASDTAIFSNSKLINLLEPGDGVMVDRGFLIDELCHKNRWKLIRPPFLHEKKQFTENESILTSKIAAARIHCERANQRIKTWAILGSKMPAALVYLADEIMNVICATVNLSNALLNDDKFMKI